MKTHSKKLTVAVLASSLFFLLPGYADTPIYTQIFDTLITTAIDGNIDISSTGQINNPSDDAIKANLLGAAINIAANNQYGANAVISSYANGINISMPTTINIFANSGITTLENSAILASANTAVSTFIKNYGNLITIGENPIVVNLLGVTGTQVSFNQYDGSLTGNVQLADLDGNGAHQVFTMTGGTVNGSVQASSNFQNQLTLNGGTINGTVVLGALGDTVNLGGTQVTGLLGGAQNDTFNISGGGFGSLSGGAGANQLFVTSSFIANGPITNIQTITIENAGTVFTVNQPTVNLDTQLTVDSLTTLVANNVITGAGNATIQSNGVVIVNSYMNFNGGTVDNSGTLTISPYGFLVANEYINENGSFFAPILTPTAYGKMQYFSLNSDFDQNSFIAPQLVPGGFFTDGSMFDVVLNRFFVLSDSSGLVQPSAIMLTFAKTPAVSAEGNVIRLTLYRNLYENVLAAQPFTPSLAATLDNLAFNNGADDVAIQTLLGGLDSSTSVSQLQSAAESLLPPFNYGLVQASNAAMTNVFNAIQSRLGESRHLYVFAQHTAILPVLAYQEQGLNYGDNNSHSGAWLKVLGAYLDQSARENTNGYRVNAGGAAIGADWRAVDCLVLGIAGSYTKLDVHDKGFSPKEQAIQSYQATAYGWYEPCEKIFMDGILALAGQHYKTNRTIYAGTFNTAALASFKGWQYGAQGDIGYAWKNNEAFFAAPLARLRYTFLRLQGYEEYNAGSLGLSVAGEHSHEFAGGLGFKFATERTWHDITYSPELTAMILYDFAVSAQNSTSSFIGGGTAFTTQGIAPGKLIFDLDLGLNVQITRNAYVTIEYDLELRDQYIGNSGYLQWYYDWN